MGLNDITLTNVIAGAIFVGVGLSSANQAIKWLAGRMNKEESKSETLESKINTLVTGNAVISNCLTTIQTDLSDVKQSVKKINDLHVDHTALVGRVKAIEDRFNDHLESTHK